MHAHQVNPTFSCAVAATKSKVNANPLAMYAYSSRLMSQCDLDLADGTICLHPAACLPSINTNAAMPTASDQKKEHV
jgi:hypothetical protein